MQQFPGTHPESPAPPTATTSGSTDGYRYARQVSLPGFGIEAQQALGRARVLVIGAGGLGSSVIPALAAAGIGTIGIIDDDLVETSNLHRQYLHSPADIGRSKVDSAADSITALNPEVLVVAHNERLDAGNALQLFTHYDVVIDGSDNFPTRYLANDAAAITGIPLVWGAVSQYAGQAGVCFAPGTPNYRDLFPTPPSPGSVLSCAVGGVLPTVCAVIGSILATETIKLLTGVGTPLFGRVTTFDALTGAFRELRYEADPTAAPITALVDYDLFCGIRAPQVSHSEPHSGTTEEPGRTVSAEKLVSELDAAPEGTAPVLLDVRETWEVAIAALPGAVVYPLGTLDIALERGLTDLDPAEPIVVYCHHGVRSEAALHILLNHGFTAARHLDGGIDAWSRTVDPALPRY